MVKKEHIIERQGKSMILWDGLLDEAHQKGLIRIRTEIVQLPTDANGKQAVVTAEATFLRDGQELAFCGIGDADPSNVNRMIVPHLLRMAETRAKARALRDGVNIGMTSADEMGGDIEDLGDGREVSRATGEVRQRAAAGERAHNPRSQENGHADDRSVNPNGLATANQLATIAKLSRLIDAPEDPPETMTGAAAGERIMELSRIYNERGSGKARRSA